MMTMVMILIALAVTLFMTALQTYAVHRSRSTPRAGVTVVGLPIHLVLGTLWIAFGQVLLEGTAAEVITWAGIGSLASYAATWGQAFGYAIHMSSDEGLRIEAERHRSDRPA